MRTLIWGTTVDPHEAMMKFKDFLLNFTLAHRIRYEVGEEFFDEDSVTNNDKIPYYPRILTQVKTHTNFISASLIH